MAWFWSPRDKRKYEIVKVEDRSFINKLCGDDKNKLYRIYYKDDYGRVEYTQVESCNKYLRDGSMNPVYKGMLNFFNEKKLEREELQKLFEFKKR